MSEDTFKIRDKSSSNVREVLILHSELGTSVPNGVPEEFIEVDEGFSNIDLYITTERNLKKNGGLVSESRPMKWTEKLVPSSSVTQVRSFDLEKKKWVTKEEPLLIKRIVRDNTSSSSQIPFKYINDLTRKIQKYTLPFTNARVDTGTETLRYFGDSIYINSLYGVSDLSIPTGYSLEDIEERYINERVSLDSSCLRKLYKGIANQPADLGTDFAEGRQTIRMFSEYSKRLLDVIVSVKRRDFKKSIKQLFPNNSKRLANDFLAYRYGVAPLVSDINGIVNDIKSHIDDTFKREATSRSRLVSSTLTPHEGGSLRKVVEITVKYKVFYGVDDEFMSLLNRVGLTNPLNVAWELVPFSFVVDWFKPIGPFLSTLGTLSHLTVKSVHRTVVFKETLEFFGIRQHHSPFVFNAGESYSWKVENFLLKRRLLPSIPEMPLPEWKNPLSLGHISNFVALLTQFVKRGK